MTVATKKTKSPKSNRKIFIWGFVAMLVIAAVITTVVLVEKKSGVGSNGGRTADTNGSGTNDDPTNGSGVFGGGESFGIF